MKELTEQQKTMNIKGEWIWRSVVTLVIALIGWLSSDYLREQKEFNKHIAGRVSVLELQMATTSGNRFSAVDWISAKTSIDSQINQNDKRITRLEDAFAIMKDTLPRLESKIDRIVK